MSEIGGLTVVIPCKNEELSIFGVVSDLRDLGCEVLVVDDGSSDRTASLAESAGARVISHGVTKGNGRAVRTGIDKAETEYVGIMDGDGQHSAKDMMELYSVISECRADLVVGARDRKGQAGFFKSLANSFYNRFASFMVGRKIDDLTSGQRIFRASKVKSILWMFPEKFSYPTTSTMIFFRLGYDVRFKPISVSRARSSSNIRIFRDGFNFFLIVTKIGTLFSPFKLFLPLSLILFFLGGARYVYTYLSDGTFTNMSALLFVTAVLVFLMGVLSEQLSLVLYGELERRQPKD